MLAHLAVVRDGKPHVTPVWVVYEEGVFYFTTRGGRVKGKAIGENPNISVSIATDSTPYMAIVIEGKAEIVEKDRWIPIEKIVKSIVLVDYDGAPLLAIVPAKNRVRFAKIKKIVNIKDVRLATPEETLEYSGYVVGSVPPFNKIRRVLLDPLVLGNETSIVGGGHVKRLVEVRTQDIVNALEPKIVNIVE